MKLFFVVLYFKQHVKCQKTTRVTLPSTSGFDTNVTVIEKKRKKGEKTELHQRISTSN